MRILVLGEQSCFSSALHAAATERGITIAPVHSTKMLEQKLQTEEFDCALLLQEPTTSLLNWLSTRPDLLSLLPTMLRCDPSHAPESPQSYGILRVVWSDYTWEEVFEQAHQMHQQFHASETLQVAGIHLDTAPVSTRRKSVSLKRNLKFCGSWQRTTKKSSPPREFCLRSGVYNTILRAIVSPFT